MNTLTSYVNISSLINTLASSFVNIMGLINKLSAFVNLQGIDKRP
jgi:hypothetical protein